MTDYFVNASSVGNGLTPSSAYARVTSAAPLLSGDRVWIRPTHTESLTSSERLGTDFAIAAHSRVAFIIGWPNSGDPFYDERPASGITAGWDSDNPATNVFNTFGLRFPTFTCSRATASQGMLLGGGMVYANLAFSQLGANTNIPWDTGDLTKAHWFDNIIFLRQDNYPQQLTKTLNLTHIGKLYLVASNNDANNPVLDSVHAEHLVVMSQTTIGRAIIGNASSFEIGIFENRSNSVSYLVYNEAGDQSLGTMARWYIGRAVGVEPYSGMIFPEANAGWDAVFVDDWFGKGPGRLAGEGHMDGRLVTSADAMYNSNRAYRWRTESVAAADQAYYSRHIAQPFLRKFFAATSGTAITINVPVYVSSTFVHSIHNATLKVHLKARGGNLRHTTQSMVLPGSPTLWSGALMGNGSAYLIRATWTPEETGQVPFDVFAPQWTQATSGQGLDGYLLFGEPHI